MEYGGVKAVGRWCQAVMSGGGVRRWQWWLRREATARVDLLIPDDEARSEERLIFSSLTMKQDLKKARSEEKLTFSSLTMKQDLNTG
ncbi:hypothetical protein GQ457_02G018490 [Hibiscus cannabinus]